MTQPTAPQGTNRRTFADALASAKALGTDRGKGKDTGIKFFLQTIEDAYQGAIDETENKHGNGMDDCFMLAAEYAKAAGIATTFDAKPDNQRKLLSNIRKMRKLGQWTLGGNGEPLGTVNALMSNYLKLRKDPANKGRLDDAMNVLLRYATMQLKRNLLVTSAELTQLCFRNDPKIKTPFEQINDLRKKVNKIIEGSAPGGAHHNSASMVQARELLKDAMRELAGGGQAIDEDDEASEAADAATDATATGAPSSP